MNNRFRITDKLVSIQKWAASGGLVERHHDMADDAIKRHDEAQQRKADAWSADMLREDAIDKAWRDAHPRVVSEEELEKYRAYIADAVAQHLKARGQHG